jgi:hypothetical protein
LSDQNEIQKCLNQQKQVVDSDIKSVDIRESSTNSELYLIINIRNKYGFFANKRYYQIVGSKHIID